jgi:hypothetical protein
VGGPTFWTGARFGYTWAFAGCWEFFYKGLRLDELGEALGERALNRAGFMGYVADMRCWAFCHSIPMLGLATMVTSSAACAGRPDEASITQATPREEQEWYLD